MDLLASYDDDGDKSQSSNTNKQDQVEVSSSLQSEWESFEKMISGETEEKPSSVQEFLQSGIVAYPGLFQNNDDDTKASSDSDDGAEAPKKTRSFADDVMKLFRSEFVEEELDMPPRPRSSSHSSHTSGSSHSSRSRSSPSPDREDDKEDDKEEAKEEEEKKETDEGDCKDRRRSRESPSKKRHSRSRSRSHRRRNSHSRRKSRSSRSRSKRRSRDRKDSSSHRRRRRSRSRDRKHRRHSSRDRHRHKKDRRRSRDRHRKRSHRSRSRHRSRSPLKHRSGKSRSRSRERGHHPAMSTSKADGEKHLTFKEKMRQQLLKASKYLQGGEALEVDGTPKEKPSTLPLSDGHKKFFQALASSTQSSVTPQMALLHTMAAMHQKAQEMTGVAVPKYYNPAAVNPLKYAEQVQKRKLLWSKAKEHKEVSDKEKEWQQTAFTQDDNGKMASKFKKLMGIKHEGADGEGTSEFTEEQKKKREEFFSRLDKDYEFARMTTHTQRGVGLGFSSQGIQPP